jgi:hypothetical protein
MSGRVVDPARRRRTLTTDLNLAAARILRTRTERKTEDVFGDQF